MTSELTSVQTPDGDMPAHLWQPSSRGGPGILLLQEIFGVSDYILRRGQDLADLGYVVLAPQIYWRIGAAPVEMGPDALGEGLTRLQQLDWDAAVDDGVAALQALTGLPHVEGGAGIVGFCFGGGLGFSVAAVSDPDVLVSYYGSSIPDQLELATQVRAASLHHFGLADSYLPPETVEQVTEVLVGQPDVRVETYPGADHAFDNPDFSMHHPQASALAWERTVAFLADRLPTG